MNVTFKTLKWQALHGSLGKRLALRTFMFATTLAMLPLLQLVCDLETGRPLIPTSAGCDSKMGYMASNSLVGRVLKPVTMIVFPHLRYEKCKEDVNWTIVVAMELMSMKLVDYNAKALFIGQDSAEALTSLHEMGFSGVDVILEHPFSFLEQQQVLCELNFVDNSFGFVIARDLKEVSVPALLVNEVERVLKPGGIAAVLVRDEGSNEGSLIRSATSVSSFLKTSNVVHVVGFGSYTLIAFKKIGNDFGTFEHYHIPINCPSINRNKPLMSNIEALVEKKPEDDGNRIAYLPAFVNVPPKGKLVYVDMGAKENANISGENLFLPSYPLDSRAFSVYIVDHDPSVLSSHVKTPGAAFVYHPTLAGNIVKTDTANDVDSLVGEDEFDFFVWFKETVEFADFVVLKMNLGNFELKFLSELFESGVICSVDELFLHCPNSGCNGESCVNVFKNLRNVGVFAHQWWVG